MKMVGSARTTLLLSKIVPTYAGPPERYFRSKELTEMDFGRLRWPAWEMDAPRPSPNQRLLSRTAGLVSVLRVTNDCDENVGRRLRKWTHPRRRTSSKAASRWAVGAGVWELGVGSLRSICMPTFTK